MLTKKENYLNALLHKPVDRIPSEQGCTFNYGMPENTMEYGSPENGGVDGFGVQWEYPESGGGEGIPAPGQFMVDSDTVAEWRDRIEFPDVASYPWEEDARTYLANVDRDELAVNFSDGNGLFERLAAFMGFEEALVAMSLEPEAVEELINAIADYKIERIFYAAKYFQPDTYTLFDDVATQNNTFMSVNTYRELLMPANKRIVDAAREAGMVPIRHCCGHAESLVESFIEEGWNGWCSVQPCNDMHALLSAYGDQICIIGGYDTIGTPGQTDNLDVIRAEIERCYTEYGKYPGFVFSGFVLLAPGVTCASGDEVWSMQPKLVDEVLRLAVEHPELSAYAA